MNYIISLLRLIVDNKATKKMGDINFNKLYYYSIFLVYRKIKQKKLDSIKSFFKRELPAFRKSKVI